MQILGAIMQNSAQRKQAIAQGRAMQAQAYSAIKSMNHAFQNYEIERRDAFDSAVEQLHKATMQGRNLQGTVDSAVAEEYGDGGNTGRLLQRSTHADTLRALTSIKDNYQRHSNEIDLNKETKLLETKGFTENLHPPKAPSMLSNILNVGMAGLNGYMAMKGAQANQMLNGYQSPSTQPRTAEYTRGYTRMDSGASRMFKMQSSPSLNYANSMGGMTHFRPSYTNSLMIRRL